MEFRLRCFLKMGSALRSVLAVFISANSRFSRFFKQKKQFCSFPDGQSEPFEASSHEACDDWKGCWSDTVRSWKFGNAVEIYGERPYPGYADPE